MSITATRRAKRHRKEVRLDFSESLLSPGAEIEKWKKKTQLKLHVCAEITVVLAWNFCDTLYQRKTGKGRQLTLPLHPFSTTTSHHSKLRQPWRLAWKANSARYRGSIERLPRDFQGFFFFSFQPLDDLLEPQVRPSRQDCSRSRWEAFSFPTVTK